ncbi:MAG: hypothetical protein GY762_15900 [Proteobacteria bacterium]|nr:hypothetical protein [Pseudomonadota bacterium]
MANIVHVECPVCRAPIGLSELSRVVSCVHCDTKLVVDGHHFVSEYYLEPKLDKVAARRALQRALTGDHMPEGLLKNSRLHSARLHFVPYNDLSARRLGTVMLKNLPNKSPGSGAGTKTETRVIMTDIHKTEPAVSLSDWALDHAGLYNPTDDLLSGLMPATRSELAHKGRISVPTVKPDHILASLEASSMAATFEDKTRFTEKRIRRIFYPVWRIRYRYQNRLYWATLDGVTGRIMGLRAPQDDRQRLKWLLGSSMMVSLVVGKLLRLILLAVAHGSLGAVLAVLGIAPVLLSVFFFFGAFFSVAMLVVAWEQFRYPGELVIAGESVEIVKLKPPGENRVLGLFLKAIEQAEKITSYNRGRRR